MDWIFDNFQILAIIGLAFASWLKHRSDAKAAEREEKQAREETGELPDWFEDEEEWRQPQPEPPPLVPPPPLRRAEAAGPPPLVAKSPPGMAESANAELQRQEQIQQRLREVRESRDASARQAKQAKDVRQARQARLARTARMADSGTAPSAAGRLRALLHDRSQTRQAILMREILGPPLGLR